MNKRERININDEPEQDLTEILTNSSLYLDMPPAEKEQMLNYLVSSYFNRAADENCRAGEPTLKKPNSWKQDYFTNDRGGQNMINRSQGHRSMNAAILIPRLWMILSALALPFFIICTNYFEAMEKTGARGAAIADILLPVIITGYITFIFVLKTRRIWQRFTQRLQSAIYTIKKALHDCQPCLTSDCLYICCLRFNFSLDFFLLID